MAEVVVSCYLTLRYADAEGASEGYRLLDEAGVREGIDSAAFPPCFVMRVTEMPRDRLDALIWALERTGAEVTEEPDSGPLVWRPSDL